MSHLQQSLIHVYKFKIVVSGKVSEMVKPSNKRNRLLYLADSVAVPYQFWLGGLAGNVLSDLLIAFIMLYRVSSFLLPMGSFEADCSTLIV